MSRLTIATVAMLVSFQCLMAQSPHAATTKQELAVKAYAASLQSEHQSVRNSAIFRAMQLHARFPDLDISPLLVEMQKLSSSDESLTNRLYAFLAMSFLTDSTLKARLVEPPQSEEDKDDYFAQLQQVFASVGMIAAGNRE